MGQKGSRAAADSGNDISALSEVEGFQVVRLLPHSPAHHAGLVPYFDIITALNHTPLNADKLPVFKYFKQFVLDNRDQVICFTVYNLYIRAYRDVFCTPMEGWGGGGLLGCSVEWAVAEVAVQRTWHILEVIPGSPASFCPDIRAEKSYIVGMQQPEEQLITLLKSESDFYARLEGWQAHQCNVLERRARFPEDTTVEVPHGLLLMLYDLEENAVKEVVVEMGTKPGTPLGVSVASGLLHIIPPASGGDAGCLPSMNHFFLPKQFQYEADYTPSSDLPPAAPPRPPMPQLSSAAVAAPAEETAAIPSASPTPPVQATTAAPPSNEAAEGVAQGESLASTAGAIDAAVPTAPPSQTKLTTSVPQTPVRAELQLPASHSTSPSAGIELGEPRYSPEHTPLTPSVPAVNAPEPTPPPPATTQAPPPPSVPQPPRIPPPLPYPLFSQIAKRDPVAS